jgi:hypothetical protein
MIMRITRSVTVALAALTVAAAPAAAQHELTPSAAEMVRQQFMTDLDTLQSKFLALADAIPEDKFAWRPAPGVRSIGEAFMHVASEFYVFTPMAYGATPSPVVERNREGMQKFEANATKADVMKHLRESFAYTRQQLGALDSTAIAGSRPLFGRDRTIVETSSIMSADLHEHLGQLIAYARMNGVTPPWSR